MRSAVARTPLRVCWYNTLAPGTWYVRPMSRNVLQFWLALVLALYADSEAGAQNIIEPFLGVRHIQQTETLPRRLNINVVEIDLAAPGLTFLVTPGGPHPRPFGTNGLPMETIRQTPRQFANGVGAQIAINGSFYSSQSFGGVPWANNLALTASNGEKYSPWELPSSPNFDDALNITHNNDAAIVRMAASIPTGFETDPPVPVYNAISGSHRLVTNGVNVAPPPGGDSLTQIHPRTAVGVTADNRLLLMTVDGRQSGFSEGVNLVELANLMLSHGALDAINLDGGGSTQMVMNFYDDELAAQVVNSPSEAQRAVGASLAVFAARPGDFNADGNVDAADFVAWRNSGGAPSGYASWRANFGRATATQASLATIPEPMSWTLTASAILVLFTLQRAFGTATALKESSIFISDPAHRAPPP